MNGADPHDLLMDAFQLASSLAPPLVVLLVGSLAALVWPALRKAVRGRAAHRTLPAFHRRRRPF